MMFATQLCANNARDTAPGSALGTVDPCQLGCPKNDHDHRRGFVGVVATSGASAAKSTAIVADQRADRVGGEG
jgi:hypothetical protein